MDKFSKKALKVVALVYLGAILAILGFVLASQAAITGTGSQAAVNTLDFFITLLNSWWFWLAAGAIPVIIIAVLHVKRGSKIAAILAIILALLGMTLWHPWSTQASPWSPQASTVLQIDDPPGNPRWRDAGGMLGPYTDVIDIWKSSIEGMMFRRVNDPEDYIASWFNITASNLASQHIIWGWWCGWGTGPDTYGIMFRNGTKWYGFTSINMITWGQPETIIEIIQSQQGL
jgi:uncharacterized membrane-anchored protein YitT (DUF2179 family)